MTGVGYLISCALSCVVFSSCQGQINGPSNQNIIAQSGSTERINWTFVGNSSGLSFFWYFTKRGTTTRKILAFKVGNAQATVIPGTGLPKFAIEDPTTLVLQNIDARYNGKYEFVVQGVPGYRVEIEFYVSVTPIVSVNCSHVTIVNQSDNFACECEGTDGNPPADVIWYKNSTQTVTGKEKAILSLSNVDKNDNGTYRCEAKSGIEEAKNEASIDVILHSTPKISVNCSSSTTLIEGDYFACECKGTDGNPPADVIWYKNNTKIVTGKEKAILRFPNVKRNRCGTYRCETKSNEKGKNETFVKLIVNYPPENARLVLTRRGQSVTITCTADGRPEPSYEIFFNCDMLVKSDKTYRLHEVNTSHVGLYKCVARNILGQSSAPKYFSLIGPTTLPRTTSPSRTSQTATNDSAADKSSSGDTKSGTEWHIVVISLVCGFIAGVLLSYILWFSHRRWFRKRKPKRNPDEQPTEADSTYQELDLSKMNQEDNYQSLRGNVATINDVTNDDESTYTELSKTRDVEDNYQSLT